MKERSGAAPLTYWENVMWKLGMTVLGTAALFAIGVCVWSICAVIVAALAGHAP